MLVAAVLRPQQREDGELELVRLALQQFLDTGELPVGEAEGAMERLFGDRGQSCSLARGPDAPAGVALGSGLRRLRRQAVRRARMIDP